MFNQLYQVYFQEGLEVEPTMDVVFSETQAKQVVLDFYNQKLVELNHQGEVVFEDYEQLQAWLKLHPQSNYQAWYETLSMDADDKKSISDEVGLAVASDLEVPYLTKQSWQDLSDNLYGLLYQQGVDIEKAMLERLMAKAYEMTSDESASKGGSPQEAESLQKSDEDEVWLIHIGEEDVGLYLGRNYIDSASKSDLQVYEDVVSTAEMLAQRQGARVKMHRFETLPPEWCWSKVENILQQACIISCQPQLLVRLKEAPYLKVNDLIPTKIEWFDAAFQAFIKRGDEQLEVVQFKFQKGNVTESITLTIEHIVHAVEVAKDFWVCSDTYGTQIKLSNAHNPTHISSLLR